MVLFPLEDVAASNFAGKTRNGLLVLLHVWNKCSSLLSDKVKEEFGSEDKLHNNRRGITRAKTTCMIRKKHMYYSKDKE